MTIDRIFSKRSVDNLKGVHPDLVRTAEKALTLSTIDFCVTEGVRSPERQAVLLNEGKSMTSQSRHLTGHAVDVMALPDRSGSWEWRYYEQIAQAFADAALQCGTQVEWGGNWQFRDGVHFQLSRKKYP